MISALKGFQGHGQKNFDWLGGGGGGGAMKRAPETRALTTHTGVWGAHSEFFEILRLGNATFIDISSK